MTVLASVAVQVTPDGIYCPSFADVLDTLNATFQTIYGLDAYIDPDSQDGQFIAAFAKSIDDVNRAAVAVYNSFSPATAQGVALSSNVKINGISRAVPTNSTVTLRVTGTVGTSIADGVAADAAGNRWLLPSPVVIPPAGYADVTATAEVAGAVSGPAGTITQIVTPTLGWQSVTNAADAAPGAPVELDPALRIRQSVSVALPSRTVRDGLRGALLQLTGVSAAEVYENDTNTTDANGLPAHSISAVVQGGASADIVSAILRKKTPGCYTYGSTAIATQDLDGNPITIRYYAPTSKRVIAGVTIKALTGYVSATGDALKVALAAYVSALGIGKSVYIGRLYVPAQLGFAAGSGFDTFELTGLQIAFYGNALGSADLTIAFNEIAALAVADITLTVT